MKVGVIGSRHLEINNLEKYIPPECDEIVSGGARGIDKCAAEFAKNNSLTLTEILPEYKRYGKGAPIIRNRTIVDYADIIIAFWDGKSKGTHNVIEYCKQLGKTCIIYML